VADEGTIRRVPLPYLVTPIVVLTVAGMVADAVGPHLILSHPLLQMFLNPRNRYLLLAAPHVAAAPFFVVGFIRLILTDPLGYLLGRQYGDGALRWARRAFGDGVNTAVQWFSKAAPLVILVAPNLYMCILAGTSRMRVRTFVALNVTGTIGRLILIRLTGDAFEQQLNDVLDFIRRYQWWLVGISVVAVTIQVISSRRRGILETPAEIEAEIEAGEDLDQA
jgi:membrane protein DedA with SNARE-associated domain